MQLDVLPRLGCTAELWGAANDDSAGALLWGHVRDELIEILEDARLFVGRLDESLALGAEDLLCTLNSGVDERDDLETRAKLAARRIRKVKRRAPDVRTAQDGKSGSMGPRRSLG